jgi:hypothetical protein
VVIPGRKERQNGGDSCLAGESGQIKRYEGRRDKLVMLYLLVGVELRKGTGRTIESLRS